MSTAKMRPSKAFRGLARRGGSDHGDGLVSMSLLSTALDGEPQNYDPTAVPKWMIHSSSGGSGSWG